MNGNAYGSPPPRKRGRQTFCFIVIGSLVSVALLALLAVWFFSLQIGPEDATTVEGHLYSYNVEDGFRLEESDVYYLVNSGDQTEAFEDTVSRMPPGSPLALSVVRDPLAAVFGTSPYYAVEVRTPDAVLLDLDTGLRTANAEVRQIAYFVCLVLALSALVSVYWFMRLHAEKKRAEAAEAFMQGHVPTAGVRREAANNVRYRMLAVATNAEYQIFFRRVGFSTELVVNGRVYDEKKGLAAFFPHALFAVVDGHRIEADVEMLSSGNTVYGILFDGQTAYRSFRPFKS